VVSPPEPPAIAVPPAKPEEAVPSPEMAVPSPDVAWAGIPQAVLPDTGWGKAAGATPSTEPEPAGDVIAAAAPEAIPEPPAPVPAEPPAPLPEAPRESIEAEKAPSPAGAGETPRYTEEENLHADAKRFARLLVSEIKLYNEERVVEGRQNRDIYVRLKRDIDRSREMYQKRVSPLVARRVDYFHDEVIRILGDNSLSALGSDYPGPLVES